MEGMGKNTTEGDLMAMIALAKGTPARAALKHAGYSENVRRTPRKVLHSPRCQEACRRLGVALLDVDCPEYERTLRLLENRNADPKLVIETTQQVHDEWVKNGRKELPGFLELPEACRVLLVGIGSDNQDLSLVPAESVTPAAIGQMALQMLWKEMLDPPSDARSRIQVIDRAVEVGGFTGKNAELHLHEHHHEFLSSSIAQHMIAEKQLEILAEREQAAKNSEAITAEVITTPEVMGDNNAKPN